MKIDQQFVLCRRIDRGPRERDLVAHEAVLDSARTKARVVAEQRFVPEVAFLAIIIEKDQNALLLGVGHDFLDVDIRRDNHFPIAC